LSRNASSACRLPYREKPGGGGVIPLVVQPLVSLRHAAPIPTEPPDASAGTEGERKKVIGKLKTASCYAGREV
jgi:hypothetical protein